MYLLDTVTTFAAPIGVVLVTLLGELTCVCCSPHWAASARS